MSTLKTGDHSLYLAKWVFYLRSQCLIKNPLIIKSKNEMKIPSDGLINKNKFIHIPDEIQNILVGLRLTNSPGNPGFKQIILSDKLFDVIIVKNIMLFRLYLFKLLTGFNTQVFNEELKWINKYEQVNLPIYISENKKIIRIYDTLIPKIKPR